MIQQPQPVSHPSFRGRIGISRVDITPPVGVYARNWGAATHDVASSIHRPLTLTVLTLAVDSQDETLVLIDADLGWWKTPETFHGFQSSLLKELSLQPSSLLFALTHTHAGPPLMEPDPSLPGGQQLTSWLEEVQQATVTAVGQAMSSQFDAILDWHVGRCGLATMRDLPDPRPGADRFVCGFNPQGQPDDTLFVGRVSDLTGKQHATLVNYACHPTTLAWDNTAISPDFIGAMRETVQSATGAPALFMQGASGDLAPRYQYVGDTAVADRHGRQLGFAALSTLHDMEPPGTQLVYDGTVESGAPLAVWRHQPLAVGSDLRSLRTTVELPLKRWPAAEELERQRTACTERALEERLRRKRDIRRMTGDGAMYDLPVHAWRIGDAVLVGCCCEPYSQLQQDLRRRFPNRTILCMNLVNGSIGYLPPTDLYDQEVYQVWQTPFDRGSLELTIDAMAHCIEKLFV
jgi:hypothetical protein